MQQLFLDNQIECLKYLDNTQKFLKCTEHKLYLLKSQKIEKSIEYLMEIHLNI